MDVMEGLSPEMLKAVTSVDTSAPYTGIRIEALRCATELIKAQIPLPFSSCAGTSSEPIPTKSIEEIREEAIENIKEDVLSLATSFSEFLLTGKSI